MNRHASRYYLQAITTATTATTATATTTTRAISSADLTIQRHPSERNNNKNDDPKKNTTNEMKMPPKEELQFGKTFSPHMLTCHYKTTNSATGGGIGGGWEHPRIVPFQDLKLSPAASVLHYGERALVSLLFCYLLFR